MKKNELLSFTMDGSSAVPGFEVIKRTITEKFPKTIVEYSTLSRFTIRVEVITINPAQDREIINFCKGIASHLTLSKSVN